tara:strand:- start:12119 stop:12490 length:372 start_codon:yes stop_codon:yes gene_type:complete
MEYDLITKLGNCIDNVYNNYAESSDRRTVAKVQDDHLVIEYRTILRVAKDQELEMQMDLVKSESKQMIDSRLRTIKSCFKEDAGRALKTKKVMDFDNIETLTVSPYNPVRTLKYTFSVGYEVS